jgi:hypothetical protein
VAADVHSGVARGIFASPGGETFAEVSRNVAKAVMGITGDE